MMDIKKCLEEGFLKKIKPVRAEIEKELLESEKDFAEANCSLNSGRYKWTIIQAYYSMFHAARAVLFSLGYKERRHFAIGIILEDLVRKNELESFFVNDFKAAMFTREEADYNSEYSKERAEQLLTVAGEFNKKMRELAKPRPLS